MNNFDKKKILEKTKQKISISTFLEEENMKLSKTKKRILKSGIVACFMLSVITGVTFATEIKDFVVSWFNLNTSEGVNIAVNNGYVADIKTEYQDADGIEIKIDSILMDDFNFDMNFNVKVSDKYNIDDFTNIFFDSLIIKDENGNVVFDTHEEIEKNPDGDHYMGAYSFLPKKINENEIQYSLSATGNPHAFPKSKKLYIDLKSISNQKNIEQEVTKVNYEGNWHFEIDVPEEFYSRTTVIYKVKSCNVDTAIIGDGVLSNTAFKISIPEIQTDKIDFEKLQDREHMKSIYDIIALQKEYVETSDGKKFETAQRSDGDGGYCSKYDEKKITDYYQTFNLTKYDATDELTVHLLTNAGEEIVIVYERAE